MQFWQLTKSSVAATLMTLSAFTFLCHCQYLLSLNGLECSFAWNWPIFFSGSFCLLVPFLLGSRVCNVCSAFVFYFSVLLIPMLFSSPWRVDRYQTLALAVLIFLSTSFITVLKSQIIRILTPSPSPDRGMWKSLIFLGRQG